MPVGLITAWTYVKKYWAVFAAILGFILFRMWQDSQKSDLASTLDAINKQHAEELAALQAANAAEQQKYAADEAKMQAQMAAIQQQYEAAQQQLDAQKKAQIQQILATTQDDPTALAQKLSEVTGFQVVLPQDPPK